MPAMPATPWRRRKDVEIALGPPVAVAAGEVADDHAAAVRAGGLVVGRVDAVVADVRVGERDDLAGVGRVGDHLLVAGQDRVEHDLAGRDAVGRDRRRWPRPRTPCRRPARAGTPGFRCSVIAVPLRRCTTASPFRIVWRTRPRDGHALVGRVACSGWPWRHPTTVHVVFGSMTAEVGRAPLAQSARRGGRQTGDRGRPPDSWPPAAPRSGSSRCGVGHREARSRDRACPAGPRRTVAPCPAACGGRDRWRWRRSSRRRGPPSPRRRRRRCAAADAP